MANYTNIVVSIGKEIYSRNMVDKVTKEKVYSKEQIKSELNNNKNIEIYLDLGSK